MKKLFISALGALAALCGALPAFAQSQPDNSPFGQALIFGFRGTNANDAQVQELCASLAAGRAGGVLFLGHNMRNAAQVSELTALFEGCAQRGGHNAIIAIDQEGGRVDRLGRLPEFARVPSFADLAQVGNDEELADIWFEMASDLVELGFNVNFAPVVDLAINPRNPVIARYERSLSDDPNVVRNLSALFIETHQLAGMRTVLKHFPGHGSSTTDTHRDVTDITATWSAIELEPYSLADTTQTAVMTGHLIHADLDSTLTPASLSASMQQAFLREKFGFNGVIVSDDLRMGALRDIGSIERLSVMAAQAGTDLLIYSAHSTQNETAINQALAATCALGVGGNTCLGVNRQRVERWMGWE